VKGTTTSVIIVRVTLGIALNDVESAVASIRETQPGQAPAIPSISQERTSMDHRTQS
jgi:hypothetical protein